MQIRLPRIFWNFPRKFCDFLVKILRRVPRFSKLHFVRMDTFPESVSRFSSK